MPKESTVKSSTPADTGPTQEPTFFGAALSAYRLAASALLTYAVAGHTRSTSDPVYRAIVEGRLGLKYSSCGDLAHWFLYRLGVRAPWINRAEFKPPQGHGWRVGLNLNLLAAPGIGTNEQAVMVRPDTRHPSTSKDAAGNPLPGALISKRTFAGIPDLEAGDTFQVSNIFGGHQLCVTGSTAPEARPDKTQPLTITTAEYGQPGGAAKTHVLTYHADSGLIFCGSSQVRFILTLPDALGAPGLVPPDLRLVDQAIVESFKRANPSQATA
jgi:hypothetical protein